VRGLGYKCAALEFLFGTTKSSSSREESKVHEFNNLTNPSASIVVFTSFLKFVLFLSVIVDQAIRN